LVANRVHALYYLTSMNEKVVGGGKKPLTKSAAFTQQISNPTIKI